MTESSNKQWKNTEAVIPFDIIESILLLLPVKSLIRFKAVSKQWEATISDPKFAEIHLLQQSKRNSSSSSQNLFVGQANELHVLKLETRMFRMVTKIPYPPPENHFRHRAIVCQCDGLLLRRCFNTDEKVYILWNPSNRTYKEFSGPTTQKFCGKRELYGIWYDPLTKDYKVVIVIMEQYAVFCCRNNQWGEMKETTETKDGLWREDYGMGSHGGVYFNGCIHWFVNSESRRGVFCVRVEVICFDVRQEKFKKLPILDSETQADLSRFYRKGGHMCMFPRMVYKSGNEMRTLEKVSHDDYSWVEHKVELPLPFPSSIFIPLCFTHDHQIIIQSAHPTNYLLYDYAKTSFSHIPKISPTMFPRLFPYQDNLFAL